MRSSPPPAGAFGSCRSAIPIFQVTPRLGIDSRTERLSPNSNWFHAFEWTPILILPNLDVRATIECEFAAIVSPADPRVEQIRKDHPTLKFLGKFSDQFREQCWPALLILRSDTLDTCRTAEAVTAFRDLVSLSTIPLGHNRPREGALGLRSPDQFEPRSASTP
jgi:hypothetical protein